MKAIQTVLALAVIALAGGVTLHYWMSGSMETRIRDAGERLDRQQDELEEVRAETGGRLDDHEARLQTVEARTAAQEKEIVALETQLGRLSGELRNLEATKEESGKEIERLRDEVRSIEKRIETLTAANGEYLAEIAELKGKVDGRDADFELRLRAIEKKLGIERPEP